MAEQDKQEQQKTVVSFVVGLLIGGLLVWAFSGPSNSNQTSQERTGTNNSETTTETDEMTEENSSNENNTTSESVSNERPVLPVGDGRINVNNQAASNRITLSGAVYPINEGWIGVREYNDGQLGHLLGVVRFSEEQGIVPTEIYLQRATTPGRSYAVVVYTDNGDRSFNLAEDVQIDQIFATFTAQ